MKLDIAILQFRPLLGDPSYNLKKVAELLDGAIGSRLIVLPELANSGYHFTSKEQALSLATDLNDSSFVEMLISKSAKLNAYIVCGINESDNGKLFNTAVLVSKEGVIGKYRKNHLYVDEQDFFESGNLGTPVFKLDGFTVGISICFDYLFPEIWRKMAEQGADIICHPSNLISQNAYKVIPALALINKVYIATANRTGSERELSFCGKSFICDPSGDVMDMMSRSGEGIMRVGLDLEKARNKMITNRNHAFKDRRPDIY